MNSIVSNTNNFPNGNGSSPNAANHSPGNLSIDHSPSDPCLSNNNNSLPVDSNPPFQVLVKPSLCFGTVSLPASKSLSHRALICAGLADGQTSVLKGISDSQDIQATMYNLKQMGAEIVLRNEGIEVTGINPCNIDQRIDHSDGMTRCHEIKPCNEVNSCNTDRMFDHCNVTNTCDGMNHCSEIDACNNGQSNSDQSIHHGGPVDRPNDTDVTDDTNVADAANHPLYLNANESGSTLRFFIPIAALSDQRVCFKGKPSLLSRPMGIYADIFLNQNLYFHQSGSSIDFQGPLQGDLFEIPGNVSSQFISGLLFALPYTKEGGAIAVLPPYESRSYVDLTLQMMRKFGIQIDMPTSEGYEIQPGQSYQACDLQVEGDYSQLAFFGVLAAIPKRTKFQTTIYIENIDHDSLQGDKVIMDILEKAGTWIAWNTPGNPVSVSCGSKLKPQVIDLADCPDLGPACCVLAAYTPGTTKLIHTSRLRYKECDRVAAMEEELKKWGVDIVSDEDSITIQGKNRYKMPETVVIDGHNDHRIVMAMTVFGLNAETPSRIQGAEAIAKSYPGFFEDIKKIGGQVDILKD